MMFQDVSDRRLEFASSAGTEPVLGRAALDRRGRGARAGGSIGGLHRALGGRDAGPTPATHAILTVLKAGETAYLISRHF